MRTVLYNGFLHQPSPLPSEMLPQVHGQSLPVLGRDSGVLQPQSAKWTTHTHTHTHTHSPCAETQAGTHTGTHTNKHRNTNQKANTKHRYTQTATKCTPTQQHKHSEKHKRESLQKQINGHTEKYV